MQLAQPQRKDRINQHINCASTSLIYIITCKNCQKQYVGQTQNALRIRIYQHLYSIRQQDIYKPVSIHFNTECQIQHFTVTGFMTTPDDLNIRLRYEEVVIETMKTRQPAGLNLIS